VRQFASVLGIKEDILYWLAGRLPADARKGTATSDQIEKAFIAFRKALDRRE
jgi:hypothetical protein